MTKSCEQHMLSLVGPKPPPLPTEQEEGERFPVFLPSPAITHHSFRCEAGSGKRRNSTLKVVFARFNLAEEQDPPPPSRSAVAATKSSIVVMQSASLVPALENHTTSIHLRPPSSSSCLYAP